MTVEDQIIPGESGPDPINPDYEGELCTCTSTCPLACKGSCGCKACQMSYQDDLSYDD